MVFKKLKDSFYDFWKIRIKKRNDKTSKTERVISRLNVPTVSETVVNFEISETLTSHVQFMIITTKIIILKYSFQAGDSLVDN